MSTTAIWLNEAFYGFDHGLLSLYHKMAEGLGGLLTPLMRLITLVGEKGLVFFLLALIFMLCASKRDLGVCIFGAVCCGALITNLSAWLSGTWFDLSLVGGTFKKIAYSLPFVHAVEMEKAALTGDFSGFGEDILYVLAYTAVMLLLSVFVFTRKMKRN
jgi:ABC-type polysaccharide/polyol phosphate export permease